MNWKVGARGDVDHNPSRIPLLVSPTQRTIVVDKGSVYMAHFWISISIWIVMAEIIFWLQLFPPTITSFEQEKLRVNKLFRHSRAQPEKQPYLFFLLAQQVSYKWHQCHNRVYSNAVKLSSECVIKLLHRGNYNKKYTHQNLLKQYFLWLRIRDWSYIIVRNKRFSQSALDTLLFSC